MNWKQLLSNKRFGLENLHEARKEDVQSSNVTMTA